VLSLDRGAEVLIEASLHPSTLLNGVVGLVEVVVSGLVGAAHGIVHGRGLGVHEGVVLRRHVELGVAGHSCRLRKPVVRLEALVQEQRRHLGGPLVHQIELLLVKCQKVMVPSRIVMTELSALNVLS